MVSLCLLCFERNLLQGYAKNYAHNFAENKAFYASTTKIYTVLCTEKAKIYARTNPALILC